MNDLDHRRSGVKPGTAIPTIHRGVAMRSRLEANVASVLDDFGIVWEYEPHSFSLGNQQHYLPDFWLQDLHTWVECRGYDGGEEQLQSWARRCAERQERFIVVRGDGPSQALGRLGGTGALRACVACWRWHLDSLEETHECASCGSEGAIPAVYSRCFGIKCDRGTVIHNPDAWARARAAMAERDARKLDRVFDGRWVQDAHMEQQSASARRRDPCGSEIADAIGVAERAGDQDEVDRLLRLLTAHVNERTEIMRERARERRRIYEGSE